MTGLMATVAAFVRLALLVSVARGFAPGEAVILVRATESAATATLGLGCAIVMHNITVGLVCIHALPPPTAFATGTAHAFLAAMAQGHAFAARTTLDRHAKRRALRTVAGMANVWALSATVPQRTSRWTAADNARWAMESLAVDMAFAARA